MNTLIANVQRKAGFGVKFIAPISKAKDYIIGFIFIDNTNLGEGNLKSSNDTFDKVVEHI